MLVVTVINWVVAPTGTFTVREELVAVNTAAFTAPKYTVLSAGTELKLVPVITTVVSLVPEAGLKEEIAGVGKKEKPGKVVIPPGAVICTFPLPLEPTIAVTLVEEFTVKEVASAPPKLTEVAPVRLVPVRVIIVPALPEAGVKELRVGG